MSRKPFPTAADRARKTLLGITIPRDELALRIGEAATGVKVDRTKITPAEALAEFDRISAGNPMAAPMGTQFRAAADAAVLYFHERIAAARQPH